MSTATATSSAPARRWRAHERQSRRPVPHQDSFFAKITNVSRIELLIRNKTTSSQQMEACSAAVCDHHRPQHAHGRRPPQSVTSRPFFLATYKSSKHYGVLMRLKITTLAIAGLSSFVPSQVQAQTVSFNTPPTFLTANGTVGATRFTINQTVSLPPINLPTSYFAFNSQPFEATTANSTGLTTVWKGFLSIAANGTISGNATVVTFPVTGNITTQVVSVNSTTSRIGIAASNGSLNPSAIVNRSSLRSESYGPYANYYSFDVIGEYPVDIVINFSNGFRARGKIVESITKSHNINNASEGDGNPSEWSDGGSVLTITGPNGHTGTIIK